MSPLRTAGTVHAYGTRARPTWDIEHLVRCATTGTETFHHVDAVTPTHTRHRSRGRSGVNEVGTPTPQRRCTSTGLERPTWDIEHLGDIEARGLRRDPDER